MDLTYRMYRTGDEKGIVDLLQRVFGTWSGKRVGITAEDYWLWKYFENPVSDGIVSLCLDGENIVGCFHSWQVNIKIGNNVYKGAYGADVAVDANYRKMGIYSNIHKNILEAEAKSNIKFHFGVEGNPILIERQKRLDRGYFPYETHKFVKIHDINKHIKHWDGSTPKQIIGYKTLSTLNTIKQSFKKKIISNKNDIRTIEKFDEQINSFWSKVKSDYSFIVERRMDYFNWRFCPPNGNPYKIFAAYNRDVLQGYLVSHIDYSIKDYPVGYIVDLLNIPESPEAVFQLLENTLALYESKGVNMILWQINLGHPYSRVAEYFGLMDTRSKLYVSYIPKKILPEDEEMIQSKNGLVHFSFADYDMI